MINYELDYNFLTDDYSLKTEKIKKTIYSESGLPLIRVNISIPQSSELTFKEGRSKFDDFFKNLADAFLEFSEVDLSKHFVDIASLNHPYSAVMRYIPAYEDEKFISIVVDSFIYTEKGKSKIKREAFNFNKENGNIIIFEDLLYDNNEFYCKAMKEIKNKALFKKVKRALGDSDFYFVPNGIACFYNRKVDNEVYVINKI